VAKRGALEPGAVVVIVVAFVAFLFGEAALVDGADLFFFFRFVFFGVEFFLFLGARDVEGKKVKNPPST
jgi:hypothetical protein